MSTGYVEEFEKLGLDSMGRPSQIGAQPSITTQTVTFTGTAGVSSAFSGTTRFVRIHVDGIASYKFGGPGATPTATTSHPRLASGQTEYFAVHPTAKVSFVTNT